MDRNKITQHSASWLLVDMGNTHIKYCWANQHGRGPVQVALANELSELIVPGCPLWLSSVGQSEAAARLEVAATAANVPLKKAVVEAQTFGLRCGYTEPQCLGVDRWLAMLAVHRQGHQPYGVIDMGTAITLDIVSDSKHLGGWITPGIDTMRDSLSRGTEQVQSSNDYPAVLSLATHTSEAVNQGLLAMALGLVQQGKAQLQSLSAQSTLYLTGGGANQLQTMLDNGVEYRENLVLEGLYRLAQET